MHQGNTHQGNTEKELMDWFDRQEIDAKWRINAYVITSGRPMAETLRHLKGLSEAGTRLQFIHPGSKRRH